MTAARARIIYHSFLSPSLDPFLFLGVGAAGYFVHEQELPENKRLVFLAKRWMATEMLPLPLPQLLDPKPSSPSTPSTPSS